MPGGEASLARLRDRAGLRAAGVGRPARPRLRWLAALAALVVAMAAGAEELAPNRRVTLPDLLARPVPAGALRIAYGRGELEFGELRLPAGRGPHPLIVLVHGGCWTHELKGVDATALTLALLRPLAAALTEAGYATWNLEYPRLGNPGGGWPGTFRELGAGLDHVRTLARRYPLDTARVIIAGHDSGGQLALWLAARPKLAADSELYARGALRPFAAVDIDGAPDLVGMQAFEMVVCDAPVVTRLLGGPPPEQRRRYRDGAASPLLPLGVRQLVVVGGLLTSPALRPEIDDYTLHARGLGDELELLELPAAEHYAMLEPTHPAYPPLLAAIDSLSGIRRASDTR